MHDVDGTGSRTFMTVMYGREWSDVWDSHVKDVQGNGRCVGGLKTIQLPILTMTD